MRASEPRRGNLLEGVIWMKHLVVLTWAALLPGMAAAADLMDVYREALANDARFAAARAELQAGQEREVQGRALLLPEIGLTAGWNRNQVDPAGQSSDRFSSHSWGVQLVQPLFREQNRVAAQQGALQTEVANVQFEQERQELMLRVSEAYFNVLNAEDALDAVVQLRNAAAEQLDIARVSFEVGTVTITDVHEAQSRFDLADAQVIAAESELEVRRDILGRIIGRDPERLATLPPEAELMAPQPADATSWIEAAQGASFLVRQQDLLREIAAREVDRSRAGHLPTLDLVARHDRSNRQNNFNTPSTDTSSIGVQFNLPLYSGGSVSSVTREAAALRMRADSDVETARREAALAAREAYLGVTSGMARIRALEAAEVSSLSALEASRLGYEVGVRINIDVLNALSQLAETRQELAQARYDTLVAQLRLKAATGSLDEDDLMQINALLRESE